MEEFSQKLKQISINAQQLKIDKEFNTMYKPMIEYMEKRMINTASRGEVKAVFIIRQRSLCEYFIQTGEEDALYFNNLSKVVELFYNQFKMRPVITEKHKVHTLEYCWA